LDIIFEANLPYHIIEFRETIEGKATIGNSKITTNLQKEI
jgi:hypothetical protein